MNTNKTFKIVERPDVKTSQLIAEMKSLFPVWSYLSDEELDKQFPPPKNITERDFLDSVEPDPETLGKSAREADPEMKGITLRERLLLELRYFKGTGNHLDIKGITICSGSRYSDGGVPRVYFVPNIGEVDVHWCRMDYSSPADGLRQVLSSTLDTLSLESRIKVLEDWKDHVTEVFKRK